MVGVGSVAAAERVGERLEAIAHPARVRLVAALAEGGERSVGDLAGAVGVSVYDASQHLRVLRAAGVVVVRREGRLRCYRLEDGSVPAVYELVAGRLREQAERARRDLGAAR
jgi:DNA-binding transcriptional ArsR family regulator